MAGLRSSFLRTGWTRAWFHISGTSLWCCNLVKRRVIEGAISSGII